MKGQFHTNPKTGITDPCRAFKSECPYIHGDTPEEAQRLFERHMEAYLMPHSASVKQLREMPAEVLRETPLKELDTGQLTQTLRHESVNLGMQVEVVDSAIDLATILHAHQQRGNRGNFTRTPYIEHPLRNALRIVRFGVNSQDVTVASILHDTIEDGAQVFVKKFYKIDSNEIDARKILGEHIKKAYGENVFELVEAVTNDYIADVDKSKMSITEKNRIYLEHVHKNITGRPNVLLVKISDFIDNATGLYHNDVPERATKTKNQATKYLPVVDVFRKALKDMEIPVSVEQKSEIFDKMDRTEERLSKIINRTQGDRNE